MNKNVLEAIYRRYIDCLNERHIDDAAGFYCDHLLYNGCRISRAQWRMTAIEDSFRAMPDLRWHIESLVIEQQNIAARLRDTGTLIKPWRGLIPSGETIGFSEHVFYRFRNGRIEGVRSNVDVSTVAI